jgi:hypothetical protein
MDFTNARARTKGLGFQAYAMVPGKDELAALKPGAFVRLQSESGSFIWAQVVRRYDRHLVLKADDSLKAEGLIRGDQIATSVGAVFSVV